MLMLWTRLTAVEIGVAVALALLGAFLFFFRLTLTYTSVHCFCRCRRVALTAGLMVAPAVGFVALMPSRWWLCAGALFLLNLAIFSPAILLRVLAIEIGCGAQRVKGEMEPDGVLTEKP